MNNVCAACTPSTTEEQACPCGKQTRTCSATGAWGAWGSCVLSCGAGFPDCINSRCGKYYTSYSGAGGPDCGYTYSGGIYTYFYCKLGDYCDSTSLKRCRTYENAQPGDVYHAAKSGGGADCGYTYSGGVYTYYYCLPGDSCSSSSQKTCTVSGTACDALYTAYKAGGGAECGYTYSGGVYTYYYCKPGDYCQSSSQKQCKVVTTCPAGAIYSAFKSAGGPQCGYTYSGGVYTYYYCFPGDLCSSSSQKQCKK